MLGTLSRKLIRSLAALVLAAFIVACADSAGPGPQPVPTVARVVIGPHTPELLVGGTLHLQATAHGADDKVITGLAVTWASDRTDLATVTPLGVVTAKADGMVQITATVQNKSGATTIVVMAPAPGPLARLEITPGNVALDEGDERDLVATGYDAANQPLPGAIVATWMTSNEDVAPVSATGVVTGLLPGTAVVSAFYQGHTATANVAVAAHWGFDLVYDEYDSQQPAPFAVDLRAAVLEPARILPAGVTGSDPAPSPDGQRIAYVTNEATRTMIYVANRAGADPIPVSPASGFADQPTWSPDGAQLAFRYRATSLHATDIWVANADGSGAANLTGDFGEGLDERDPAWSRAGPTGSSRIAFVRVQIDGAHIWSMRFDGTGKRRVTFSPARDQRPDWSPDGSQLVFTRDAKLWVVDAAGLNARELVQLGGSQLGPVWSPDGNLIAFASSHEAPSMLYTIWADGTRLARRGGWREYLGNLAWRAR